MVKKLIEQSIIFNRNKFKNRKMVRDWIMSHNFKIMPKKKGIDITEKYYRVRQREPCRFKKTSFITEAITKDIKCIMGKLK